MAKVDRIVALLGGAALLGADVSTLDDLAERLRDGLPYSSLESVLDTIEVSREELAHTLHLPLRTLARRKKEQSLQPDESDRLYRVARVYAHAGDVFDDGSTAARWMHRPNRALGGRIPLQLLDTDIGVQQVDEVLGRIEYGVFS